MDPLNNSFRIASDYTAYLRRTAGDETEESFSVLAGQKIGETKSYGYSYNGGGRVLVCPCLRGEYWSATIRSKKEGNVYSYDRDLERYFKRPRNEYQPEPPDGQFFSIGDLTEGLHKLIVKASSPGRGLIVISGRTGTAKSKLARGLIHKMLKMQCEENIAASVPNRYPYPRKPHLVTYEDPIEEQFDTKFFGEACHSMAPFDYTPRQRGIDVVDLMSAFEDALRQTPSVFFVGEVRNRAEWSKLLKFAGTGHLIITTTHAGSLREALATIFDRKMQTPSDRADVAERVLAVVHLASGRVASSLKRDVKACDMAVTYPELYRRTDQGLQNLISNGLSTILPNERKEAAEMDRCGSLGRRACMRVLLSAKQVEDKWDLLNRAFQMDLSGK